MSSPGDRSLFDLWRVGDEQAARELLERYADAWSPWRAGGSASVEERQILELRMQGFGTAEIAKKLFRLLERIRSLAEREELAL